LLPLTTDEQSWLASLNIGEIVCAQPFAQARTNQVFLLTAEDGQQVVFKRLNLKARAQQQRKRELAIQRLANEWGLSPKLLADCGQYRLQEYVRGEVLENVTVAPHFIEIFAAQLQNIHQLPANAQLAPPQNLSGELQRLKKQLNSTIDETQFQHFLQLALQLDKNSSKDTLCHGDLSAHNLIQAENGQIKILDWEYAVLACPAYDLASCCAINAFISVQQKQLIELYYQLSKKQLPLSLAQLQKECALYLSVFTYLNELWEVCFQSE
jgi:thiamine kinase-like enzyme